MNYREDITREGIEFIHMVCDACSNGNRLEELLSEYDVKKFKGGSGNRVVCEFPDEFLSGNGIYFDDFSHNTFSVLKASHRPDIQNYKEIQIWQQVKDSGDGDLFAAVNAWDGAYRWLLMKRVTPVSPYEGDTPYNSVTGSGQEYYYDPEVIDTLRDRLNKAGWEAVDADENTGFHEELNHICLMDYGGVSPIDSEITIPPWVSL